MPESKKITTRLFPLSSDHVAVFTAKIDDPKELFNLKYAVFNRGPLSPDKKKSKPEDNPFIHWEVQSQTIGHKGNAEPCVTPLGYYFHEELSGNERQTQMSNILNDRNPNYSVDESLDTSLIAMTNEDPARHQLVAVSKDRKTLYLYGLKQHNDNYNRKPYYQLHKYEAKHSGKPLYIIGDSEKQIVSVAGFSKLTQHFVAMALNTGEILVGEARDDQYGFAATVLLPPQNTDGASHTKLLSTPQGWLIAYHDNVLDMWDLTTLERIKIECQAMFNLSTSIDGKYLTGLQQQGSVESNQVFCLELPSLKRHTITLDQPVADFVIGDGGRVCMTSQCKMSEKSKLPFVISGAADVTYPGLITDFLPKHQSSLKSKFLSLFDRKPPENDKKGKQPERRLF